MEQVRYNVMLDMMQGSAQLPQVRQSSQSEGSDFHKLMEQTQSSQSSQGTETRTQPKEDDGVKAERAEESPSETTAPVEERPAEESPQVQEQMAMSMLAAMQNPVVPVEQTMAPAVEEAVTLLPVEQVVEGAVQTGPMEELAGQPVQTGETAAELPPQQAQTVEQPEQAQAGAGEQVQPQTQPQEQVQSVNQAENSGSGESLQSDTQAAVTAEGEGDTDSQETVIQEAPLFRQVESTPIKVGEAAKAAQPAEAPSVETQVGETLTEAIQNGQNKVELHLQPANLGKVSVELTVTDDGVLEIVLKAENSQTRGLLERDAGNLQSLLSRDSQQEVRIEVPHSQESQQTDIHDQEQQKQQQQREQEQRQEEQEEIADGVDFLQQLRLGLITLD